MRTVKGEEIPDYLRRILMDTHPYVLVEDDCIVSEQYQTVNDKQNA